VVSKKSNEVAEKPSTVAPPKPRSGGISEKVSVHIPRAAQTLLVERGKRLFQEGSVNEALHCFLSLLYAVESQEGAKNLPTQLTECLRGAAECYRSLGQPDIAVKFLQAERRVFEEMVVAAAFPDGERSSRQEPGLIVSSLLGKAADEKLPKRCYTLIDVAEACAKLGYHDMALAYRVKASALKSKISGKALDPESEEAAMLARALHDCKLRHAEGPSRGDSLAEEIGDGLREFSEKMRGRGCEATEALPVSSEAEEMSPAPRANE
jgi:hypothetical protein